MSRGNRGRNLSRYHIQSDRKLLRQLYDEVKKYLVKNPNPGRISAGNIFHNDRQTAKLYNAFLKTYKSEADTCHTWTFSSIVSNLSPFQQTCEEFVEGMVSNKPRLEPLLYPSMQHLPLKKFVAIVEKFNPTVNGLRALLIASISHIQQYMKRIFFIHGNGEVEQANPTNCVRRIRARKGLELTIVILPLNSEKPVTINLDAIADSDKLPFSENVSIEVTYPNSIAETAASQTRAPVTPAERGASSSTFGNSTSTAASRGVVAVAGQVQSPVTPAARGASSSTFGNNSVFVPKRGRARPSDPLVGLSRSGKRPMRMSSGPSEHGQAGSGDAILVRSGSSQQMVQRGATSRSSSNGPYMSGHSNDDVNSSTATHRRPGSQQPMQQPIQYLMSPLSGSLQQMMPPGAIPRTPGNGQFIPGHPYNTNPSMSTHQWSGSQQPMQQPLQYFMSPLPGSIQVTVQRRPIYQSTGYGSFMPGHPNNTNPSMPSEPGQRLQPPMRSPSQQVTHSVSSSSGVVPPQSHQQNRSRVASLHTANYANTGNNGNSSRLIGKPLPQQPTSTSERSLSTNENGKTYSSYKPGN